MSLSAAPRATLILLTYNQRTHLEAAARACFGQIGEPIEILMSDDASTDGSFELMQSLAARYEGPHTVRIRRNERNLGIGGHYNQAIAACSGELLITAAGDDISLPHRVQTLLRAWDATGQTADLIASHVFDMSSDGRDLGVIEVGDLSRWRNAEAWVRKRPYVIGASHAFTKRMHKRFGPFDAALAYEDQVMTFRACCMGGGVTVSEPLVRYRRGGLSKVSRDANTPEGFLRWMLAKHTRQRILFSQVHNDIVTAGRPSIWGGAPRRNLARSELMLKMLEKTSHRERIELALNSQHAGRLWALRYAMYIGFPQIAIGSRRLLRADTGQA